jgi:hypothetical protein
MKAFEGYEVMKAATLIMGRVRRAAFVTFFTPFTSLAISQAL